MVKKAKYLRSQLAVDAIRQRDEELDVDGTSPQSAPTRLESRRNSSTRAVQRADMHTNIPGQVSPAMGCRTLSRSRHSSDYDSIAHDEYSDELVTSPPRAARKLPSTDEDVPGRGSSFKWVRKLFKVCK